MKPLNSISSGVPKDAINPDWDKTSKVHDWKNYIYFELKTIWHTFDEIQKRMIANNAQIIADSEDWE